MTTRSKLLLAAMLLVWLAACGPSDEVNSSSIIPSAQAGESTRAIYPELAADAEPGGQVHEYY
jgi:hypothetical protein